MIHPALVPASGVFRSRDDATDPRVGDHVRPLASADELTAGDVVLLGVRTRGRPWRW